MPAETPYVNQLGTWDEDAAIVAAKQVKQLTDHPGWVALMLLMDQAHENVMRRLTAGHTLEHAEYARITGYLQGLREPSVAAQAFQVHAERVTRRNEQDPPTP